MVDARVYTVCPKSAPGVTVLVAIFWPNLHSGVLALKLNPNPRCHLVLALHHACLSKYKHVNKYKLSTDFKALLDTVSVPHKHDRS